MLSLFTGKGALIPKEIQNHLLGIFFYQFEISWICYQELLLILKV
jgi:hypothetical protein